jgi:hypothetical protein
MPRWRSELMLLPLAYSKRNPVFKVQRVADDQHTSRLLLLIKTLFLQGFFSLFFRYKLPVGLAHLYE